MDHVANVRAQAERPYANRSYILHHLDKRHFDVLNWAGHVCGLNGYCLDALDESPQGCMVQFVRRPAQGYTVRGKTWDELLRGRALAEKLIDEILSELEE
jgi:hypothetical protein